MGDDFRIDQHTITIEDYQAHGIIGACNDDFVTWHY